MDDAISQAVWKAQPSKVVIMTLIFLVDPTKGPNESERSYWVRRRVHDELRFASEAFRKAESELFSLCLIPDALARAGTNNPEWLRLSAEMPEELVSILATRLDAILHRLRNPPRCAGSDCFNPVQNQGDYCPQDLCGDARRCRSQLCNQQGGER